MRIIYALILSIAICAWHPASASGPIEIWNWAFVVMNSDGPVALSGASLFKPSGDGLEGPLNQHPGEPYHLKFSLNGKTLTAELTPPKGPSIAFQGSISEVRDQDGKGCSILAQANSGPNYILIHRYQDSCPKSN